MPINMILAVDPANNIGYSNGDLPWHIPGDLKRFKELTMGCDVILGYNTFKSIQPKFPAGFPGRRNHVLTTKQPGSLSELTGKGVILSSNLAELCATLRAAEPAKPVWICGGAKIYDQAIDLQLVDNIYLTIVSTSTAADVRLSFELAAWKLFIIQQAKKGVMWEVTDRTTHVQENLPDYSYVTLTRIKE